MPLSHTINLAIDCSYRAPTYVDKILALAPIAYWPLNETGGAAANCLINSGQDGTYSGVSLNNSTGPDNQPVGLWDGANDYCNVYSAALNGSFDRAEGSLALWLKVSGAGVWIDGSARYPFCLTTTGSADRFWVARNTANNRIDMYCRLGGVQKLLAIYSLSTTDWLHLACTWSVAADQFIIYSAGSAYGSPATSLGTPSGNGLLAANCNIGAYDNSPAASVWDGYLAHVALWDSALTPSQIAALATV